MTETQLDVQNVILELARKLVDTPAGVRVDWAEGRSTLEIHVDKSDLLNFSGQNSRTLRALNTVANACAGETVTLRVLAS